MGGRADAGPATESGRSNNFTRSRRLSLDGSNSSAATFDFWLVFLGVFGFVRSIEKNNLNSNCVRLYQFNLLGKQKSDSDLVSLGD